MSLRSRVMAGIALIAVAGFGLVMAFGKFFKRDKA